jgi:hypothetical protein
VGGRGEGRKGVVTRDFVGLRGEKKEGFCGGYFSAIRSLMGPLIVSKMSNTAGWFAHHAQ